MQESATLRQGDLELINALQINPRASWSLIGNVLRIDPVTCQRRWSRLESSGYAWVSAYPLNEPTAAAALVEVSCLPGKALAIAEELALDAQCMNVDVTTGARDVMVTLTTMSASQCADYLLHRFDGLDGVIDTTSHMYLRGFADGSQWRPGVLTASQEHRLRASYDQLPPSDCTDDEWSIGVVLGRDGRAGITELAKTAGVSESTVRRRLNRLLGSGQLTLRCDLARECSGYPIGVFYFMRIPARKATEFGVVIGKLPQIRLCGLIDGVANFVVQAWVSTLDEVATFEARLSRAIPDADFVDRSLILRTVKRVGRRIDETGRAISTMSTDIRQPRSWQPAVAHPRLADQRE